MNKNPDNSSSNASGSEDQARQLYLASADFLKQARLAREASDREHVKKMLDHAEQYLAQAGLKFGFAQQQEFNRLQYWAAEADHSGKRSVLLLVVSIFLVILIGGGVWGGWKEWEKYKEAQTHEDLIEQTRIAVAEAQDAFYQTDVSEWRRLTLLIEANLEEVSDLDERTALSKNLDDLHSEVEKILQLDPSDSLTDEDIELASRWVEALHEEDQEEYREWIAYRRSEMEVAAVIADEMESMLTEAGLVNVRRLPVIPASLQGSLRAVGMHVEDEWQLFDEEGELAFISGETIQFNDMLFEIFYTATATNADGKAVVGVFSREESPYRFDERGTLFLLAFDRDAGTGVRHLLFRIIIGEDDFAFDLLVR